MLPWGDPSFRFKKIERRPERISTNLQLGGQGPFAGKEFTELSFRDHLLDDRRCLSGQILAMGEAWHG